MAFMNTPVTHGSGVVVVTGTGADTELGKISAMLTATAREKSPLTKQLDTLTLWIVAAAGLTMFVMFVMGRSRGEAWDVLFVSAIALAIAAIPEALPSVTQMILSLGSVQLADRNAIVKELPSVETLGFTSAINSDKTGTLTMNQMTAVELVTPTDRYKSPAPATAWRAGSTTSPAPPPTIEDAILPYVLASDARLIDGRVVGDPTEGALLVLAHKAGLDIDATRDAAAAAGHAAVRPDLQAHGDLHPATDADGPAGRPVLRQGRGARRDGTRGHGAGRRPERPVGRRPRPARRTPTWSAWSARASG